MPKAKAKWSAKAEIRKLDKFCREIVLARDKHQCRRCGKGKGEAMLHWAHVISRSKKSVRWNLTNSMCLCYYCHFRWAHENPLAFSEFVKEQVGAERHAWLILKSNQPMPLTPESVHTVWGYLGDAAEAYGVKLP